MLLDSTPISTTAWTLMGIASLLVCGGSVAMLLMSLRKPSLPLDDDGDPAQTRSGTGTRNRPSPDQNAILDGMATSGSHPTQPKDPTAATRTGRHEEGRTSSWKELWSGIVDTRTEAPQAAPVIPPTASDPDSMTDRPDFCPFCGLEPKPDYVPQEVEGGVIHCCPNPDCRCIVYVVPRDIAHKYLGATYHVPEGQPFAIPRGSRVGAMLALPAPQTALKTDKNGMVVELFSDLVDKPTHP